MNALQKSKILLFIFSTSDFSSNWSNAELNYFIDKEFNGHSNLIFPLMYDDTSPHEGLPEIIKTKHIIDFSSFKFDEITKSTKLKVLFGQEVEKLASTLANAITKKTIFPKKTKKTSKESLDNDSKKELNDLLQLAREYDDIRKTMPSGSKRTSRMSNIVTRMKSVTISSNNNLPILTESEFPGERLAAIVKLQLFPNIDYLDWLAEHVGDIEKPFIGYQASTGLYIASRVFGHKNYLEIDKALKKATQNLNKFDFKDPNQVVILKSAITELNLKR